MSSLAALAAGCALLSGPQITAGDLARVIPAFASVDPAVLVAASPLPGIRRVFTQPEIARLQAQTGATGATHAPDTLPCFERRVVPLHPAAIEDAIRRTLGTAVEVGVMEFSQAAVPPGELVFPRETMGRPPVALWRGYVRYDGDRRFSIWARVRLTHKVDRIVAVEALQAHQPVHASQLALRSVEEFPEERTAPATLQELEGVLPKVSIAAGSAIWADQFDPPREISKGDVVDVVVTSGKARFRLLAEAASDARRGQNVALRNVETGKQFQARVEGTRRASITLGQNIKPGAPKEP